MRYGADPWSKMILARVTDLQFGFPQSGAAQLTVIGEDLLSLLKTKPDKNQPYADRNEDFIVGDVLHRSKADTLGLKFIGTTPDPKGDPLKGPLVAWPELQPLRSLTHNNQTTYLAFLQGIAERMDFELFVDFTERLILDSETPPDHANTVKLHFEPARSVAAPKRVLDLVWGRDLIEFTPRFKMWELLTKVEIGGTKHGTRAPYRATIEPGDAAITADLQEDPTVPADRKVTLLGAADVRKKFFDDEGTAAPNAEPLSTANLDPDRARLMGIATLRRSLREALTAEGSTIGVPALRPGMYVCIRGLYPPFDGLYYVTQTVHTFDGNGYRTQFSLRRPGMLDPTQYPATKASS
ncbi:MAG: hypothetical protein KIT31_01995 [Deltaproteobacteria bacterium]|nr:hypothetical protein [Deltaproteobacteria bacterium]